MGITNSFQPFDSFPKFFPCLKGPQNLVQLNQVIPEMLKDHCDKEQPL